MDIHYTQAKHMSFETLKPLRKNKKDQIKEIADQWLHVHNVKSWKHKRWVRDEIKKLSQLIKKYFKDFCACAKTNQLVLTMKNNRILDIDFSGQYCICRELS